MVKGWKDRYINMTAVYKALKKLKRPLTIDERQFIGDVVSFVFFLVIVFYCVKMIWERYYIN